MLINLIFIQDDIFCYICKNGKHAKVDRIFHMKILFCTIINYKNISSFVIMLSVSHERKS